MKFTVDKSALLPKLNLASSVVSSRSTLPILESMRFSVKGDILSLYITDLEVGYIANIPVIADGDFSTCIPVKLLKDSIAKIPDQELDFRFENGSCQVFYNSGKGSFRIVTHDATDYPNSNIQDTNATITLNGDITKTGFNKAMRFVKDDQLRPVLSGVLIDSCDNGIRFVATDANRLLVYKVGDAIDNKFNKIVPIKACRVIEKLSGHNEHECRFTFGSNMGFCSISDETIEFRLIDGQFPNYESVIPRDNNNVVTIEKGLFANILERASIFAPASNKTVSFGIDFMELTISARDIDMGNDFSEVLDIDGGATAVIGLRANFVLDAISCIDSDKLQMKVKSADRAVLFAPEDNEDTLCLVMPVVIT